MVAVTRLHIQFLDVHEEKVIHGQPKSQALHIIKLILKMIEITYR